MPNCGSFRDLIERLDAFPSLAVPRAPARKSPPHLKDLAEKRWLIDGILRLAFVPPSDEDEDPSPAND